MSWCGPLDSSCLGLSVFLGPRCLFPCQVKDVFSYYFFKKFSAPFSISSPSKTPIMWVYVHLMLSPRSFKLYSFFSHFFLFSFHYFHYSCLLDLWFILLYHLNYCWFPLVYFLLQLYSSVLVDSLYILYPFVEIFMVFIHFYPKFCDHNYDHYPELFIE